MFGLNLETAGFPYWMALYNQGQRHFQLLRVTDKDRGVEPSAIFAHSDLPLSLVSHCSLCNERPFGASSLGGVS